MADFTGITTNFTSTYDSTNKEIDILDSTDYVGQGFTRSDADLIIFGAYKAHQGDEARSSIIGNTTVPTTVASWTDDVENESDGWYRYTFIYAFDFAATGGTHQLGDVVRDSGTYYIYTSSTVSSAAVTDATKWAILSVTNYESAKIEVISDIFLTRNGEECVFNARIDFIKSEDCGCKRIDCKNISKREALLLGSTELFNADRKTEAQEVIELLNSICCG